ncbi:hypothetical protein Q7P35_001210 [Cladosporium inversicolor]
MDNLNPSAPSNPSAGPSSTLRPRSRLQRVSVYLSDDRLAVKCKDPKQSRAETTDNEPPVKRFKRSLPPSDFMTEHDVIDTDDNNEESVGREKVASIPVGRHDLRQKLTPVSMDHATTSVKRMSVNDHDDTDVPSPGELDQMSFQLNEALHALLAQSKRKVSMLQAELVKEREFTEQVQKRVRQDMMMDIMRLTEKLKKTEEAAVLAKRRHEKEISEYKVKLQKGDERSLVERTQTLSAQRAVESYRFETEHLQHINALQKSDLQDLRVVDDEDRRARKDDRRDLPPAYGNLNDEEQFPPYSQQADAGSIELANLKREIRRKFDRKLDEALARPEKKSNAFCLLSAALMNVSQSLHTILIFAKDIPVSHARAQNHRSLIPHHRSTDTREVITMQEQSTSTPNPLTGALINFPEVQNVNSNLALGKRQRRRENNKAAKPTITLIQTANAAPYVAHRIIKLILELLWRTVSACELRSTQRSLDAMFDHTLPLMHTSVDEVLEAALRLAFSKSHSLAEFHDYLTQVDILARKFKGLGVSMTLGVHNSLSHFDFFAKTLLWLNEQVEKERELRANESVEKMVRFEGFEDDDGVSSRWEGSDDDASSSDSEDD